MSRFIESVCFEKGEYKLIDLHQERINKTFRKFYPLTIPFDLLSQLPKLDFKDKYKVRVVYSNESVNIEFAKYLPAKIEILSTVETKDITYSYKFEKRDEIDKLYKKREKADDIIIVKNGWLTDSWFANLAFWDGKKWYTPNTYLLNGVKRQFYLRYGLITEKSISPSDIKDFEKISLINAMLDLGDIEIDASNVLT